MACTYRFKDASGKEVAITGQAAMKAYLAEGGLQELMGDGSASASMDILERQGDVTTTDDGASVLRDSAAEPEQAGPTREQAENFIRRFVAEYPAAPEIILSESFHQLPKEIQSDAFEKGSGPNRVKGAVKRGKAYIVLDNHSSMADLEATMLHEVIGHVGLRKLFGDQFAQELNRLFIGLGGRSGLRRIMDRRGLGDEYESNIQSIEAARDANPGRWTDDLAKMVITEEVMAHIAEQQSSFSLRDRFATVVGMVRDWLRRHGFLALSSLNEADLVFVLSKARAGLRGGEGIVRGGVTVGANVIVDAGGRTLAVEGSPEFESMKVLADLLGLRETTGPTVFSDSLPDPEPALNQPSASASTDAPSVFRTEVVGPRSVRTRLAEFFDSLNGESAKTFNWWQRTIGSQYGKAKSDRDFGRVYDAAHAFLDGVADFAKSASALAPNILPHLDTLRDVAKGANVKRQWSDSKDYQAISSAIFEGTLSNGTTGQVWSDQELRDRFGLNDRQISLYREFRQSVDFSLETLAASEMARLARAAKLEVAGRDVGMDEALAFYMKQLDPILKEARAAVEGKAAEFVARHAEERAVLADASVNLTDAQTKLLRDEMDRRHKRELDELMAVERDAEALRDSFVGSVEQIRRLEEQGYAPLMRFGQYTVDVVKLDEEGKPAKDEEGAADRPFFGMFETESEAKRAAKILSEEYPGYAVTQGVLSVDSSQLYRGLTPETAELFARLLGTDEAGAFQAYLKQAVANRSATKRLINRMGIEGFSNDVPRVLAAFITSNARLASGNWHFGEMNKAAEAIPKHKGDVKGEAIRLMQYVQNPQEEAAGLRGFLFFSFLGGSIASAITNLTQTFSTTLPYLHQFAGPAVAKVLPKAMALSGKMMTKGLDAVPPGELRDALKKASDEGVVDPQEIHLLMAESGGNGASIGLSGLAGAINKEWATPAARVTRSLTQAWGMFFGAAEKYNRHVAFIAAWEVAPDGVDRYEFAKNAVTETQFDYCVDTDTEILTAQGWKRFDQIQPGEKTFSVNENGELMEDSIKAVHIFGGPRKVTEFSNANGLSIVVTDGHRNMIQNYNSRDRKWQKLRAVKTPDLKGCHNFLRVPLGDATGRKAVYTDDQVRLLAWVASEGWFAKLRGSVEKKQVRIGQSNTHNPEYVAEIESLLGRLGGHFSKYTYDRKQGDSLTTFVLRKPMWEFIGKALPAKRVTMDLLSRLTPAQMRIFLETFAKGDGTFLKEGGFAIGQKCVESLHVLQAMAVLSGQSSTMWERHQNGETGELRDYGTVYVCKQSLRAQVSSMKRVVREVDTVWCPETENGTWIARRNGRTFITGNSKASRPNWARGAVGATLFTFKTFAVNYVEFMSRLPPRERAVALGVLFLMAGLSGMPGADDLDDVVDTVAQKMGYNWNNSAARHAWLVKTLTAGGADFVERGLSSLLPLDVSARLGMGNLVPGSGVLMKSNDKPARDIQEFFGPIGSVFASGKDVFDNVGTGKGAFEAVKPLAPKSMGDIAQAIDMIQTGQYRDRAGRKVVDVDALDAAIKAIGFQPNVVAGPRRVERMLAQSAAMHRAVRQDIHTLMARGRYEGDADKVEAAREMMRTWNEKNPETPIRLNPTSVAQRVRAMRQTSAERLVKATPKDMRGALSAELAVSQ